MNPALRTSAAHVFVSSLDAPELDPDDAHHLLRVLRLRDGEVVTVSDGNGGWRQCIIAGGALVPDGAVIHEPAVTALTIAAAIPKGDRVEWMVQKLTEVGVGEIVLLHCVRSAVRWDGERSQKQLAKLRKIAREAAMQSRRVWLPTVSGPVDYAEMAAREGAVVAEPDGTPFTGAALVIIGPEGGFSPDELALARATVCLSQQVLRIETAAVVAAIMA